MARPTLLFALAAIILTLAAFSATALKPHKLAAPPPAFRKHPNHAPPHSPAVSSVAKKKHAHKKHAHKRHIHHAAAPSPVDSKRHGLPPEPYPGFYALADRCLDRLTEECGLDIFRGIFGDDEAVSDKCCVELVAMGRRCHRGILTATLTLPELSKRDKKQIRRRDAQVWSQCVLVSEALQFGNSPSSSP
ncbi:hypothetical protein Pfo_027660 [Paulownia fortunei]|nr:hypothetical protein Pfo_027660 [Paulownia fortunei]